MSNPIAARAEVNLARETIEIFAAFCLGNAGRPDQTEAFALAEGLETLESNILKAMGPQTPADQMQGWIVLNEPELKVVLAVSSTEIAGLPKSTCSVAGDSVFPAQVISELSQVGNLGEPASELETFGGKVLNWEITILGSPSTLMVSHPTRPNTPGVTLGLISDLNN